MFKLREETIKCDEGFACLQVISPFSNKFINQPPSYDLLFKIKAVRTIIW